MIASGGTALPAAGEPADLAAVEADPMESPIFYARDPRVSRVRHRPRDANGVFDPRSDLLLDDEGRRRAGGVPVEVQDAALWGRLDTDRELLDRLWQRRHLHVDRTEILVGLVLGSPLA